MSKIDTFVENVSTFDEFIPLFYQIDSVGQQWYRCSTNAHEFRDVFVDRLLKMLLFDSNEFLIINI